MSPVLELRHISKSFSGVPALTDVSMTIRAGEVHMLLGSNGAGKSTLMKILYGAVRADSGDILCGGQVAAIAGPADARALGIAVIFQEFSLVPHLSVADNIFLGREFPGRLPWEIDRRRARAEAKKLMALMDQQIDPDTPVHSLGSAQQQVVEIAKALSQDARILVMDEPTTALSDPECRRLFGLVRQLRDRGVAIVYISHRLGEVFELGDRITVLRDGRVADQLLPGDTDADGLVSAMSGRPRQAWFSRRQRPPAGELAAEFRGVEVRVGEIVGLAGLVGSGRSELVRALFGADAVEAGEVSLFGRPFTGGPPEAVRHGVGFLPENRKEQGLALIHSLQRNLLMASLWKLFPGGWFRPAIANEAARAIAARVNITGLSVDGVVGQLSGGNQQKVVIGKWLAAGCRLFIFDEPTKGIDVGAKIEIFRLMEDLVGQGAAILFISSEFSEIVQLCDRAYVMQGGRVTGQLAGDQVTEAMIMKLALRHD